MKNILILSLAVLIFSCGVNSDCKRKLLTSREKNWFKNYQNGELRLYRNQFGKIDTFTVAIGPSEFSICNKIELSEYIYERQYLKLRAKNCYKQVASDCGFSISFFVDARGVTEKECAKKFRLFDLTSSEITDLSKLKEKKDTMLHFGESISSYHFDSFNARDAYYGYTQFRSFDVSKKYGLIRYELKNGERFELWKIS
ncbi:hypothetical protein [Fluviicola sp.]|uniref:hypothetical protein n=1 Tax=Fluviicola sp. TaxID=1917219 RepID=UPI0031D2B2F6